MEVVAPGEKKSIARLIKSQTIRSVGKIARTGTARKCLSEPEEKKRCQRTNRINEDK